LFRALKLRYNGAYYLEWPTELIERAPTAIWEARRQLASDRVRFAQFLLFRQAQRLEEHAHAKGLRLIGAAILARDPSGRPMPSPPVLWDIESDPSLAGTKLIAEAWDAAGLYQVGSFIGDSWKSGTEGSATTCVASSAAKRGS
jgi:hypothetical protein